MEERLAKLINDRFEQLTNDIGEIKELKATVMESQEKIAKLEISTTKHEEDILLLKKAVNRNNLIFFGLHTVPLNSDCLEDQIMEFATQKLKIAISPDDISFVYKLGKEENSPIKVGFRDLSLKNCIMGAKKGLKDLNLNVFINEDLPKEMRILNAKKRKELKKKRRLHEVSPTGLSELNKGKKHHNSAGPSEDLTDEHSKNQ